MEPLPIALCITDLDVGGAERCLVELATRLDRQRFCPAVYCLSPPPKPPVDGLLPLLQQADVAVHFLDGRHVWQFPVIVGRLQRLLAAQRPRVLQSFLFHANLVGRIAARRAGVPRV